MKEIHYEIGLVNLDPVATLNQSGWYSVIPVPTTYPLYQVTSIITEDLGDLPLLYHEIGHTLHRLYIDLGHHTENALTAIITQKRQTTKSTTDPSYRDQLLRLIKQWEREKAYYELEEIVCDIVGSLIGGPAFCIALLMGFLTITDNPFMLTDAQYPPIAFRVSLALTYLKKYSIYGEIVNQLSMNWSQVETLSSSNRLHWYDAVYDTHYAEFMIDSIEDFLIQKDIDIYKPETGGIRKHLFWGGKSLLTSNPKRYEQWSSAMINRLRRKFAN